MTTDQLIPKSRDDLLRHSAAKGRLTFVLGPLCYGRARAGHTAYTVCRAHLPTFVATAARFVVIDAPEHSTVNVTAGTVTAPDGTTPARVLGTF